MYLNSLFVLVKTSECNTLAQAGRYIGAYETPYFTQSWANHETVWGQGGLYFGTYDMPKIRTIYAQGSWGQRKLILVPSTHEQASCDFEH